MTHDLSAGVVHKVPDDFAAAIVAVPTAKTLWESITPLARNEWICWIEEAKKPETRQRRIEVGISKMTSGMRRPCCWAGCPHRPKPSA
ncbi:YdeI/OmpD-associated family protein [Candidatus Saccharibacteria bacterium]|nr:YdeI/OmpD-associated family protein [Candidatus Saccharibacteria bacterium]